MRSIALVAIAASWIGATGGEGGRRLALVVGNAQYRHVPPLRNPGQDAALMARTLRELGFTLSGGGPVTDLDKVGLDAAVQRFGGELQGAEVGLFYYSGHGVQVRGANYLVPTGANATREADVDFQMVDAALVLRQMEAAGTRLNIVILDACRNNPFGGRGLRSAGAGLAQMQAPDGTLISFATQPGNVAQDGDGTNSPFARALAESFRKPGLGLFDAFNDVGLTVKRETGGAQQPWVSASPISGRFAFTEQPQSPPRPAPPQPGAGPRRIVLRAEIGGETITAELVRDGDAWTWTERGAVFRFRTHSESEGALEIVDEGRDMYHRLDLSARTSAWRIGRNGEWNSHYGIASVD